MATNLYVNIDWAGSEIGDLIRDGSEMRVFGTDAFADIQSAVNAADTNDSVIEVRTGVYEDNVKLTKAVVGEVKNNLTIKAAEGADVDITGVFQIGQYKKVGETVVEPQVDWAGGLTIEGIDFISDDSTSLEIPIAHNVTVRDCSFGGDSGNYMVDIQSSPGGSGNILFEDCEFGIGYVQIYRANKTAGRGVEFTECDFDESTVNVQGGNDIKFNDCDFSKTLTDYHTAHNFYIIRSNDMPITVNGGSFNVDAELSEGAKPESEVDWAILWQRGAGTTTWNVNDVTVNYTQAAADVDDLLFNENATTTDANAPSRITFNNLTTAEGSAADVADLLEKTSGYAIAVTDDTVTLYDDGASVTSTAATDLFVNSAWAVTSDKPTKAGTEVAPGKYYNINAFSDAKLAMSLVSDETKSITVYGLASVELTENLVFDPGHDFTFVGVNNGSIAFTGSGALVFGEEDSETEYSVTLDGFNFDVKRTTGYTGVYGNSNVAVNMINGASITTGTLPHNEARGNVVFDGAFTMDATSRIIDNQNQDMIRFNGQTTINGDTDFKVKTADWTDANVYSYCGIYSFDDFTVNNAAIAYGQRSGISSGSATFTNVAVKGNLEANGTAASTNPGPNGFGRFDISAAGTLVANTVTFDMVDFRIYGSFTMDTNSLITVSNAWTNTGTFTVDYKDTAVSYYKIVDYTGTSSLNYGTVNTAEGISTLVHDKDLYVTNADMTELAVNSAWGEGVEFGETVTLGDKSYLYGINGFATIPGAAAVAKPGVETTITLAGDLGGKASFSNGQDVILTGTAAIKWTEGWLFVGRGVSGADRDALTTLTIKDANISSIDPQTYTASTGFNVSGYDTRSGKEDVNNGVLNIEDSTITCDYLYNRNLTNISNSTATFVNLCVYGKGPGEAVSETTATLNITDDSTVTVTAINGMPLGNVFGDGGYGVINVEDTSDFIIDVTNTTGNKMEKWTISDEGTLNLTGTATFTYKALEGGAVVNNGAINMAAGNTFTATSLDNKGSLTIFADDTAEITVGSFTNSGEITIDVTGITGSTADVIFVTSDTGTAIDKNAITLTGEGAGNFGILAKANGGISVAKAGPIVYVNEAWEDLADGTPIEITTEVTATKGINAFAYFDDAIATAGKTIYLYGTNTSANLITGKLEDSVLAAGGAAGIITFTSTDTKINTLVGNLTIGNNVTFGATNFVHNAANEKAAITVNGTFDVLATTATLFEGTMTVNGKVVSTGESAGALVIRDGYSLVVNEGAEVNVNTRILNATATLTNASMAADLTIANNKGVVDVSTATITGKVTNAGLITVNDLGTFSAASIENTGTINLVIDVDDIDVETVTYKLINITGAGAAPSTSGITVNGEAWSTGTTSFTKTVGGVDYTYRLMQFENDICLSSIDVDPAQVYVNGAWATGYEYGQMIEKGKYYLINAFGNMSDASKAVPVGTPSTITVSGDDVIVAASAFGGGQNVTITGKASFDWGVDWMYVGRDAAQGDVTQLAKVTFKDATITRTTHNPNNSDRSINISGAEKDSTTKGYGQVDFDNSTVTTEHVVNKNVLNVMNGSELTVTTSLGVAGRPASETPSGEDYTAVLNIDHATVNGQSKLKIGNEGKGVINLTNGAKLKAGEIIAAKSVINATGSTIESTGALTNSGSISLAGESTMTTGAITNSTNGSISADNSTIAATSIFTYGSFTATNNSEIKSTSTHITNLTTFNVTDSTVSASGSFLNGRDSNKPAAKATFTNATLTGSVTNYENATLSLTDSSITRTWGTITNNGTFKDLGGSTITIKDIENTGTFSIAGTAESKASTLKVLGTLTGTIELLDGAKISDSSIAASADESGLSVVADATVAFSGENTFTATTIANAGTITINAMTDLLTAAAIAEGEASSITIDATDFTLAYKKIIDLSQEVALTNTKVNVVGKPDDVKLILAADGDVILAKDTGAKNLYVSDTFAGAKYGDVVELEVGGETLSLVYGINAFSNSADMRAAITEETTDVFFTAGNTTSYGDLDIDQNVTITAIGEGEVLMSLFQTDDSEKPANTVTVAADSTFRFTSGGALTPQDTILINGTLIFNTNGSTGDKNVYSKSAITVNKTGSLVYESYAMQNTREPITVYGTMTIGLAGEDTTTWNGYAIGAYPKIAGNEGGTDGTLIIDGKEGEGYGVLSVYAPAFSVAAGYASFWKDSGANGIVTVQKAGTIFSNAYMFRNGKKGVITVKDGSSFTIAPDDKYAGINKLGSGDTVYATGNDGLIDVQSGSTVDFGALKDFTNYSTGKIKVSDEGSEFKISALTNNGTIEGNAGSTITVSDFKNNGTVTVAGTAEKDAILNAAIKNYGTVTLTNVKSNKIADGLNQGAMTVTDSEISYYKLENAAYGATFTATNSAITMTNNVTNVGKFITTGGSINAVNLVNNKGADWSNSIFSATGTSISATNVTNSGVFTMIGGSISGASVSTTGDFNVSGEAELTIGTLEGTITLADGADVTATITTGDAGVFSVAAETAAALSGNVGTASVTNAGTLIVSDALTASTISGNGTIKITAEGAVAAEDPIAVKANVSNGIINLVVSDETLAGETGYQFVAGTIGEGVTFQVNGTAYAENVVIKNSKGEDTNYVLNSKGGTGLWMVQKASTQVLSVSSAYTPATDGWNISKFASLVLALKGVQSDTVSLVVEDGYAPATPETLTDDLIVTFAADAAISGKAFTLAGDEDANKENLILRAADGKTLTIGNNITLNNANIVLNYGKQSTAIVSGNLKGYEVQIDGNATVSGTLTADTLLWLRNGKSVSTPGAEDNAIALSKAVSAETVLISSGKVTMTADADVTGTSLIIGSVDDNTAAVSIVSTGADWEFSSNMLATGTNADSFTLNGGSLTFNGGESSIRIGTRVVADDTALIENANFTLTLNDGAKLNAKKIDNIGKIIIVDGSATEINATAIVNRASAEVPIPAQKAIINAQNITAGSIENYGTIGNLEVENQRIAKLDVGTLANKQYGDVFATVLEADSIENSGEIVVKTLTITSTDGVIDNKAGGKIAQDNEPMTIAANAINNAGEISTHGGAITATDITNGAYDDETGDGLIWAGSIEASGTITNKGMIEAPTITAAAIENNGGSIIVTNGTISSPSDIKNTGNGTLSLSKATVSAPWIANGSGASVTAADGSVINASINNYGLVMISDSTVSVARVYATQTTAAQFVVTGDSALTITDAFKGTISLIDANLTDASVKFTGGDYADGTVVVDAGTDETTFNGVSSFGNLSVAEGAMLSIVDTNVEEGAIVGPCLTVNGDFSNAGLVSIDVTAFESILAEGKAAQVVSVLGNITNAGSFEVTAGYQVIVQNEYEGEEAYKNGVYVLKPVAPVDVEVICVNQAWKDNMQPGETFEFAGVDCVYGLNAFQNTNEILNLTDYTDTLIFAGGTAAAYKSLVLNTGAEIELQVVKSTGSGVTDIAFEGLSIGNGTEVNVTATAAALGDLTVADGAVLTFDKDVIQTVTATSATITDSTVDFEGNVTISDNVAITDSTVDFEGNVTISDITITRSRVNTDEDTKTSTTTVNGNVVITDSDMDFDGVATITGDVTIGGDLGSEVEFDRDTTISGKLTLDEGSTIEADQGFSFTAGSSEINGTFYATNKDDENPSDNTDVNLGTVSGTGTIYTDVKSDLTFNTDSSFQGTLSIDVTGLTIGDNKNIKARDVKPYSFGVVVTGDGVAEDTDYKKYFEYTRDNGFTQRDGACNVYLAEGDAGIAAATSHSWTVGTVVYRPDVIIVSGSIFADATYFTGANGDSDVRVNAGKFNKIAFGGEKVQINEDPDDITWTRNTDLNLTIEKGNFTKNLLGGDNIKQGGVYKRKGDSNLTIKDGTFGNDVAAGLVFNPNTDHMDDDAMITVENTNLTISGGVFNGFVYGGNYAINKGVSGSLTVKGDSTVTLIAGENDITFNKSLYVGSYGYGKVKGKTELVITGAGTITVVGKIWGGCSGDFISEGINNAYISPSMGDYNEKRNLTFTGFNGSIVCDNITAFSNVNVLNKEIEIDDEPAVATTYATLNGTVDLSNVSNWTFDFGSTLSGSFKNDFSKNAQPEEKNGNRIYHGDTLTLNLADANWADEEYADGWTLFDNTINFSGFDGFESVSDGADLTFEKAYDEEDAFLGWYAGGVDFEHAAYTLENKDNAIVLINHGLLS